MSPLRPTLACLAAVLLLLPAPAEAAQPVPRVARYVGGDLASACAEAPDAWDGGGAGVTWCGFSRISPVSTRIVVQDALVDHVTFRYVAFGSAATCPSGEATDEVEITLPAGCDTLNVGLPLGGATTGEVFVV